jgi:hypothetical protein
MHRVQKSRAINGIVLDAAIQIGGIVKRMRIIREIQVSDVTLR